MVSFYEHKKLRKSSIISNEEDFLYYSIIEAYQAFIWLKNSSVQRVPACFCFNKHQKDHIYVKLRRSEGRHRRLGAAVEL